MQAKFTYRDLLEMTTWVGDGLFKHACINSVGDTVFQREFEILNNTWVASYNQHDGTFMVWQRVKINHMENDHATLTLYSESVSPSEMTGILMGGLRIFILDRLYDAVQEERFAQEEDDD